MVNRLRVLQARLTVYWRLLIIMRGSCVRLLLLPSPLLLLLGQLLLLLLLIVLLLLLHHLSIRLI